MAKQRCGSCRFFEDAGIAGSGWCHHPLRRTSSDLILMVRRNELACRDDWSHSYWEAGSYVAGLDEPESPTLGALEPLPVDDLSTLLDQPAEMAMPTEPQDVVLNEARLVTNATPPWRRIVTDPEPVDLPLATRTVDNLVALQRARQRFRSRRQNEAAELPFAPDQAAIPFRGDLESSSSGVDQAAMLLPVADVAIPVPEDALGALTEVALGALTVEEAVAHGRLAEDAAEAAREADEWESVLTTGAWIAEAEEAGIFSDGDDRLSASGETGLPAEPAPDASLDELVMVAGFHNDAEDEGTAEPAESQWTMQYRPRPRENWDWTWDTRGVGSAIADLDLASGAGISSASGMFGTTASLAGPERSGGAGTGGQHRVGALYGDAAGDAIWQPANPVDRSGEDVEEDAVTLQQLIQDWNDEFPQDGPEDSAVAADRSSGGDWKARPVEIAPGIPRNCRTCRDFRPGEQGSRGWCANQWAFAHRQMVDADAPAACESAVGSWWLPADDLRLDQVDISAHATPTPHLDRWVPGHRDLERERKQS